MFFCIYRHNEFNDFNVEIDGLILKQIYHVILSKIKGIQDNIFVNYIEKKFTHEKKLIDILIRIIVFQTLFVYELKDKLRDIFDLISNTMSIKILKMLVGFLSICTIFYHFYLSRKEIL